SLGATETQTIFKVVLPTALPGIISAVLLAISRVIGESAALIYTMGTAISDNPEILQPATTLAVQIWSIMSGEQPNFELASAISIIILVVVLSLNILVKAITTRLNRKWEA
ncbi:MAG TPA: ABC transporter permease subunit, partial [Erysipelothrix sp.]|nr:ABC transporter permease subunit [Erysipelothrix sp.]